MKDIDKMDDELQRLIFEEGDASFSSEDGELYQKIRKAVKEEPVFTLGDNFAEMVTREAFKRKAQRNVLFSFIFKGAITLGILLISAAAFYFIAKDVFTELTLLLFTFKYQLIFVLILLMGIQIIDRIILQKKDKENISRWA